MGHVLLISLGLLKLFWSEVIHHAAWLQNQISCHSLYSKTPFEVIHNWKPDLGGIRPFGVTTWVKDLNTTQYEGQEIYRTQ